MCRGRPGERLMANFDGMRRELERKARATGTTTARDIESRLRQNSPSASGNMRNRTNATSRAISSGTQIDIKVDTAYAHIVRAGQRSHVIRPRNAGGVLVFQSRGRTVFARSVNHPGAQPRTWWDDTIRDIPDLLQRNWRGVR